ncbi:L-histidine N(alpha)-methyltransferase [Novosphingobium sp. SCN 63-17]|mgnify:CR=1 FL=1|uniref:L-histidine N(alpha)-methyltransferase n=1 Tax=Novosphingobium sp. SCN 63-17 TaxID=1660120 RepID=UPI000A8BF192|nr:L-histidine N(alpha)-methyltransferase [Novosphingobium sp. SCN 63-17]
MTDLIQCMANPADDELACSDLLCRDALTGLSRTPKTLPSKHFYDARGSDLFEEICLLDEYYVTRTEEAQLRKIAPTLSRAIPPGAALVEFGSGASVKTRRILDASQQLSAYLPIDISEAALAHAATRIRASYPALEVAPIRADFTADITLPERFGARPLVGFFPGSTIGNFTPDEAETFLANVRRLLGAGACLILGADSTNDPAVLRPAYDDRSGVTAAFNLNLLTRLNRECGADFDLDRFEHRAVWNAGESRIEMHLVSLTRQEVRIADTRVQFAPHETIHTENSYKYQPAFLSALASRAGWAVRQVWQESDPAPFSPGHAGTFCTYLLDGR